MSRIAGQDLLLYLGKYHREYKDFDGREINASQRKLFNVAVTRARFQLYVVGHFDFCRRQAKNNALSDLLELLMDKKKLPLQDAKAMLPGITWERQTAPSFDGCLEGKHIICQEASFQGHFTTDVMTFKRRLIIFSPFMTQTRLACLLPAFMDAVSAGKQIIVVTKPVSERNKREQPQYQLCEEALRDIGVSILHKKGMHEKLIFVDSEAVWIGSLNALSFTGSTGEVMQRFADSAMTAEFEKIFAIPHLTHAAENTHEQQCPICAHEMLIGESRNGGIYWQCAAADFSRSAETPHPVDGMFRCTCGAPMTFSMKKEPRWVCTADTKHAYHKVRQSDLRLPRMAALIPDKATRRLVDQYFVQKGKTT